MCGRYVSHVDADLEREWNLVRPPPLFSSFNVTPGRDVPVVRRTEDDAREAVLMRWGLVPFWAKGEVPKYSTINATAERIQTAPTYRGPWKQGRRCLFPVQGFYEWQVVEGRKAKKPWFIRVAAGGTFALGGLWDSSHGSSADAIESCTIITLPANELMAEIHNTKKRMPLIISPEYYEAWLSADNDEAFALVQPYPADELQAWPVSTYVNSPRHDGPACCEPIKE